MGQIEPELVSDNLSHLDSVLAGQTAEKSLATRQRYKAAIERYRKEYEAFVSGLDETIRRLKAATRVRAEVDSQTRLELSWLRRAESSLL